MDIAMPAPDPGKSALIIVDMQNDFVHPDGGFARRARENPQRGWDMEYVMGTIPQVRCLLEHFVMRDCQSYTSSPRTIPIMLTRNGRIGGPD